MHSFTLPFSFNHLETFKMFIYRLRPPLTGVWFLLSHLTFGLKPENGADHFIKFSLLLTVSMSVLMLGGSNSRVTDSTNTKKAMTIRKRPLMKPERISTRPNLQSNDRTAKKNP